MDEEKQTAEEGSHDPSGFYTAIAVLVFLAVLTLIFSWNDAFYSDYQIYFSSLDLSPSAASVRISNNVGHVTIDFGNGRMRAFEGQVQSGMTILSALNVSSRAGKFDAKADERGRIVNIDGVKNNSGKRWQTYLNETIVHSEPADTLIRGGDDIAFRFE